MSFKPLPDPTRRKIKDLDLDPDNPRLPDDLHRATQPAILKHMQEHYDLLRLANSIAQNGFYPSEPLIAVQSAERLLIVEGNRRLAALRTLGSVPEGIQHKARWDELSTSDRIPTSVPVLVAKERGDVAAIIGYRHIAGIEPWDPWAKARFIGRLVDDQGKTYEEVSEIVSESVGDVTAAYRNYRIIVEANKRGLETAKAESEYGVFSRAMTSSPLKKFVGIGPGVSVKPKKNVLPRDKKKELGELFDWMFGDNPVIKESRDITKLGKVVDSKEGLQVLRKTGDLEEAEIASGGRLERLLKRLSGAAVQLEKADEDFEKYGSDDEVQSLLGRCRRALNKLRKA